MLSSYNAPKGAIFSPNRRFRYALWRLWSQNKRPLLFIGLNPSRADEIKDDPTVARCMSRAYQAGFGGLLVGNLFGYISTDPHELLSSPDKIGIETDIYLKEMIGMAARILCGWGAFVAANLRAEQVTKMIPEPYCLGITKSGHPRHPLYISYAEEMVRMGK